MGLVNMPQTLNCVLLGFVRVYIPAILHPFAALAIDQLGSYWFGLELYVALVFALKISVSCWVSFVRDIHRDRKQCAFQVHNH